MWARAGRGRAEHAPGGGPRGAELGAGRVGGAAIRKITSETFLAGRTRPGYVIESDTTDHIAIHKAPALARPGTAHGRTLPRR